jgi:hypothetical protein
MKKLCLIVLMLSSSYMLSAQDNGTSGTDTSRSRSGKMKLKIKSTNPNRTHHMKKNRMDSTKTTGSYYDNSNGQDNTNSGVNNSTNNTQNNGTINNSSQSLDNNSTTPDNSNVNNNNSLNGNANTTTGDFSTTMSNSATMNSALMAGNGLPVLETFVPSDLVNTLRTKYGANLYDITAVKGANATDIYMVRTGMGNYTTSWVNADGTAATPAAANTTTIPGNR